MKVLGALVLVVGIILFVGNTTGTFRTFPGAGWLTLLVGGAMMRAE